MSHLAGFMAAAVALFAGSFAAAQQPMHVAEPTVNLGDTSFLDARGGPGVLLEEIGDGYHAGSSRGPLGQVTDDSATNSVSSISHVVFLTSHRLVGAFYGVEILGVAAHVNAGDKGAVGGAGDLTVSPVILQWRQQALGRVHFDQRFVIDSELPVGEYDRSSGLNLSGHAFTVHPYYAITAIANKRLETSCRIHYLWNSTNHAPPRQVAANSTQAGQAIHLNATTSFLIGRRVWAGANGYYLKQITAPKINGSSVEDSPEQVGAIGPGVVWDRGKYLFYVNGYHEFSAENRPQGNRLVLRVQWILGKTPGSGH